MSGALSGGCDDPSRAVPLRCEVKQSKPAMSRCVVDPHGQYSTVAPAGLGAPDTRGRSGSTQNCCCRGRGRQSRQFQGGAGWRLRQGPAAASRSSAPRVSAMQTRLQEGSVGR